MTTPYVPPGCKKLSELTDLPQMRVGIQGYGGTGKTWTALTFPNPIVANLDRGLGAHTGRADVIEIPFYNDAFCRSIMPNYTPAKLKDILQIWLSKEGKKLNPDQTLVWDGNTSMQNAYHRWYGENKVYTQQGKEDDFAQWRLKTNFYAEIIEQLKFLPCHVVYIAHEAEKKEKDGSYRGKIRPLLTGQFADELLNHFTSWFRQHASDKPADLDKYDAAKLAEWGCTDKKEFKVMLDSYPRNTVYWWQTSSDSECDCKCSDLVGFPARLPASYEWFKKYQKHK